MNNDLETKKARTSQGVVAGVVGICANLVLGIAKLVMGVITGSIAIEVDAINNLGDSACSFGTTMGFKLAAKKPDSEHPLGHARLEYVIGILIAMIIVVVGVEFAITSVEKIVSPAPDSPVNYVALGIMIASILVKIALAVFYKVIDKKVASIALSVSVFDSVQDVLVTSVAIVAMFFPLIDGYIGLVISIIVILGGIKGVLSALDPILGRKNANLSAKLTSLILAKEEVLSVHHLILHDYGPFNTVASAHVEVYDTMTLIDAHHLADDIERQVKIETGVDLTLHVDPIDTIDTTMAEVADRVRKTLTRLNPAISCHDFEYIEATQTYVFDVLVPFSVEMTEEDVRQVLTQEFGAEVTLSFNVERV